MGEALVGRTTEQAWDSERTAQPTGRRRIRRTLLALLFVAVSVVSTSHTASAAVFYNPTIYCGQINTVSVAHGVDAGFYGPAGYYRVYLYQWNPWSLVWEYYGKNEGIVYPGSVVGGDQSRAHFNVGYGRVYAAWVHRWDLRGGRWVYQGARLPTEVNNLGFSTGNTWCKTGL